MESDTPHIASETGCIASLTRLWAKQSITRLIKLPSLLMRLEVTWRGDFCSA